VLGAFAIELLRCSLHMEQHVVCACLELANLFSESLAQLSKNLCCIRLSTLFHCWPYDIFGALNL
jgi:hypothetical protein